MDARDNAMDEELEWAIDRTGRDKLGARAQSYGRPPGSSPSAWAWWQIAHEIIAEETKASAAPRLLIDNSSRPALGDFLGGHGQGYR
jgi:hypothetical protein